MHTLRGWAWFYWNVLLLGPGEFVCYAARCGRASIGNARCSWHQDRPASIGIVIYFWTAFLVYLGWCALAHLITGRVRDNLDELG